MIELRKNFTVLPKLIFLNFSFPSYVTTANPVEQILGVEAEGIEINFDHSKYFCWGGGDGEGGQGLYLLELF